MKLGSLVFLISALFIGGFGLALIVPFYREYTLLDLFSGKIILPMLGLVLSAIAVHMAVLYGQKMKK